MLNDITRCHGVDCHRKHQCGRHTAPIPDDVLLSWVATMNPERAHLCSGFIPAEPEATRDPLEPNDLSLLSEEEFLALAPQGYHGV